MGPRAAGAARGLAGRLRWGRRRFAQRRRRHRGRQGGRARHAAPRQRPRARHARSPARPHRRVFQHPARRVRGPDRRRAGRRGGAGGGRVLDRERGRPRIHVPAARGPALVQRRRAGRRRLRGRHAPAGGSGHRVALRAGARAGGERGRDRARRAAAADARRERAGRAHGGDPPAAAGSLPARTAGATRHLPRARAHARPAWRRVRAPGADGVERRLRAQRLGGRLARRGRTQRVVLERRRHPGRARALRASHRPEHRVPPVPRRRARLQLRGAAAAVRLDPRAPAGRAARVAAVERLLLRLQPDAPSVQGPARVATGAVHGDRPRSAHDAR